MEPANRDRPGCHVVSAHRADFSGLGCLLGGRWNSSRILSSTPVWTSGDAGGGKLDKSQRFFPFTSFWFPAGRHSAAGHFRTFELRGMW